MRMILYYVAVFFSVSALSGCIGYQLGGNRPEGVDTVRLLPIVNKSSESAIELELNHALRSRIQFDGRVALVEDNSADARLEVSIVSYSLTAISYDLDQSSKANSYRIRLSAKATLKDSAGEVLASAENYGEDVFVFHSDLSTSKRNAAQAVSQDLAKYLINDLLDQW